MKYMVCGVFAVLSASGAAMGDSGIDHSGGGAGGNARVDALSREVQQLRAEIASMRVADGEEWLTQQRAEEVRALVHEVLADADTRASLLQSGAVAGHDGGFFLSSPDGNFLLKVGGQIQTRYVYNFQDEGPGIDTNRNGFEMRRTKLSFSGHAFNPTWEYEVVGGFERSGGAFVLEDAKITKDFENGWHLTFGQFKLPFLREELVSSKRQLAVDRSLVNEEFTQDRSQGVELGWESDNIAFAVSFNDGLDSENISALTYDTEYAFTGRVEWLGAGTLKQFRDFTSWKGEEYGMLFGAAAHFEEAEYGTAAGPEVELFTWTADASFEFGGANLFAALIGRHLDAEGLEGVDQFAIVVQGGIFVTDDVEVFGRYEWADLDVSGVEDLSVVTAGVNKYFDKHNLKWTTDVGFGLEEVNGTFATSGAGYRVDAPGNDGQLVFRSQFQLVF